MYDITVKDSSLEEKHDWHEYKLWKNINTTINFFFFKKIFTNHICEIFMIKIWSNVI